MRQVDCRDASHTDCWPAAFRRCRSSGRSLLSVRGRRMTTTRLLARDWRTGAHGTTTPQQQIAQMLTGYWVSQALYVAAKLGLVDLLKDGPRTAGDLAVAAQAHPRALYRLLR